MSDSLEIVLFPNLNFELSCYVEWCLLEVAKFSKYTSWFLVMDPLTGGHIRSCRCSCTQLHQLCLPPEGDLTLWFTRPFSFWPLKSQSQPWELSFSGVMSHHLCTVQVQTWTIGWYEKPVNDYSCEMDKEVVRKFCGPFFRRSQLCKGAVLRTWPSIE